MQQLARSHAPPCRRMVKRLVEDADYHKWHRRVNGMRKRKFTRLAERGVGSSHVPPHRMGGPTYAIATRLGARGSNHDMLVCVLRQTQVTEQVKVCSERQGRTRLGSEG